MNKLAGRKMKFYIRDRKELYPVLIRRLLELGVDIRNRQYHGDIWPYFIVKADGKTDQCNESHSLAKSDEYVLSTLDDLYDIKDMKHVITIDNKEIVISHESYLALKENLK